MTRLVPNLGKMLLMLVGSATLASAQTLLTGGDPTDGLALNPAHVVDAIYNPWDVGAGLPHYALSNVPTTFQGVTFTSSSPNITLPSDPGQYYLYSSYVSEGFGGPDTAVNAGFTNPGSPSDEDNNLLNLVNAGLNYSGSDTSFTVTINNLTPNASYQIDSIISLDGWPDNRTDTVAYNGGSVVASIPFATDGSSIHNIYDVENVVQANGLGQIQVTYGGDQGAFYSGLVVSSLVVPEPATWAMMLAGLLFLGFCIRRKRAQFHV